MSSPHGGVLARAAGTLAAFTTALLVAGILTAPGAAAATTSGTAQFHGHGYGHGRGLSQYGAYGYAVNHGSSYQWILAHYYGGTTLAGNGGNPVIGVRILGQSGQDSVLTGPNISVDGTPAGASGSTTAVKFVQAPDGQIQIQRATSCTGTFAPWGAPNLKPAGILTVRVAAKPGNTEQQNLLTLCRSGGTTSYRGVMRVERPGGAAEELVNMLPVDTYLAGVVPHEMIASWGNAGNGRGMQALDAQAVAARSYALSYREAPYANICDTTRCQAYQGVYTQETGKPARLWEDPLSTRAVTATAGQVLRMTATGAVAAAEYSASSGGWTAPGTFPAVVDAGDATANNPYHTWDASVPYATVAAKLGLPDLTSLTVVTSNGLGADGGRAVTVRAVSSTGTKDFTGDAVRAALGLYSDWFTISGPTGAQATGLVTGYYTDLLGRQPDGALSFWVGRLLGGQPQAQVGASFVNSGERVRDLITGMYQAALGRSPDSGGLSYWSGRLSASHNLFDIQVGMFCSAEAIQHLGNGDLRNWVNALYEYFLGRAGDTSGLNYWTGQARTSGTASVVRALGGSAEARNSQVNAYYQHMLGRPADRGALAAFAPSMTTDGHFRVPQAIAASREYLNRTTALYGSAN